MGKGQDEREKEKETEGKGEEEFNMEEMLANQINVNLELREVLEKLAQRLEEMKTASRKQGAEINGLEDEKAELKLRLLQLQDSSNEEMERLKDTVATQQELLERKDQVTTQIVEEKEKRIL
jgi:DNA repair ATPase RecN